MSFHQNISFGGYNPFMMGCFNPRLNFFLGLAAGSAGIPYYPVMPSICGCSIFTPYMAMGYASPVLSVISSNSVSVANSSSNSQDKQDVTENKSPNVLSNLGNSAIMKNVPKERKIQILTVVDEACKKYNVDPKLVISMMYCESGFNPDATSRCGAAGLMQLMPGTAKSYGATDAYDIKQNIFAGVRFLSNLQKKYNGNRDLMVAAYNAGPGRVKTQVPNIKETQNYVAKVNKIYASLA